MDPDVVLERLRALLSRTLDDISFADPVAVLTGVEDLVEEVQTIFLDLDDWLSKGGFLPKDWQGARSQ